jgi:hypothetical protein
LNEDVNVLVEFWLEQNGERVLEGSEIVLLSALGDLTELNLLDLTQGITGEYDFVVQGSYGDKTFVSRKTINVVEKEPALTIDVSLAGFSETVVGPDNSFSIVVGSNKDSQTPATLTVVVRRNGINVFENKREIMLVGQTDLEETVSGLPPGEYEIVLVVASGLERSTLTKSFLVEMGSPVAMNIIPDYLAPLRIELILQPALIGVAVLLVILISWGAVRFTKKRRVKSKDHSPKFKKLSGEDYAYVVARARRKKIIIIGIIVLVLILGAAAIYVGLFLS